MPAPLPHSSASILEFESLRDLLRGYAQSELGRKRVDALQPTAERPWMERQQQLTAEIRNFLREGGSFDFAGLEDLTRPLEKSRIQGAALEIEELRSIIHLVERASEWREIANDPPASLRESEFAAISHLSREIIDFSPILRIFKGKILPDGTLDDHASPELARIRREIERQKRSIQDSLRGYLRRLSEGGTVQDELITIRGERFVIPVKIEQKRRVQGVVHGASSSGQTVFVEPLETIEHNNELVRLIEEELVEIHRILLEMTRQLGAHASDILRAVDILAELELQFAKAKFANDYSCLAVTFSSSSSTQQSGDLDLLNARHPLLERNLRPKGRSIIPLSLSLIGAPTGGDPPQVQLIISGPNTGGKTVALKTVGLLALMAQSGIPVPAERAVLPIFSGVFADIGDYQSIEQNLSTFSAHVTNIDFISRVADRHSLVLLDELGSATDPEEGAALAVAIADHFRRMGALSIISTHHTSLKVYAANNSGVVNAAVGFDEKTLQPTYELRIGVPGASAGINIAQRLGLNPQITAAARAKLATQTQDIARFLDQLHADLDAAARQRTDLSRKEVEVSAEKRRLELLGVSEVKQKTRDFEKKIEQLIKDFEYQARESVAAVQDKAAAQKLSKDAERRMAKLRREFKEQFDSAVVAHRTGADIGDPDARPHEAKAKYVSEGDTIKLKSLGKTAVVRRKIDENTFEVEMGIMKMRVPRSDIAEVFSSAGSEPKPGLTPVQAARARGISVSLASGNNDDDSSAPTEINVIGRNVDEATDEVEKFVDRAFLAGVARIRIVHGVGMGVLRKSLRQFLQKHPHVATVSEPPQHEGGAGATVVELRS